jgi:HSP20 family protein
MYNILHPNRMAPAIFRNLLNEIHHPAENPQSPAGNLHEHKNSLDIELCIPGFRKEEISIEAVENRVLKITGKKAESAEDDSGLLRKREFHIRDFSRSYRIGKNLNPDEIQASLENGILRIRIPKISSDESRTTRQITLN